MSLGRQVRLRTGTPSLTGFKGMRMRHGGAADGFRDGILCFELFAARYLRVLTNTLSDASLCVVWFEYMKARIP